LTCNDRDDLGLEHRAVVHAKRSDALGEIHGSTASFNKVKYRDLCISFCH
jgi:hypothetical protein